MVSYVLLCLSTLINGFIILISDLQLDVKGCRDVYASFDKYVEVERLEGDNKYHAEDHGLQVSCSLMFWSLKCHLRPLCV